MNWRNSETNVFAISDLGELWLGHTGVSWMEWDELDSVDVTMISNFPHAIRVHELVKKGIDIHVTHRTHGLREAYKEEEVVVKMKDISKPHWWIDNLAIFRPELLQHVELEWGFTCTLEFVEDA